MYIQYIHCYIYMFNNIGTVYIRQILKYSPTRKANVTKDLTCKLTRILTLVTRYVSSIWNEISVSISLRAVVWYCVSIRACILLLCIIEHCFQGENFKWRISSRRFPAEKTKWTERSETFRFTMIHRFVDWRDEWWSYCSFSSYMIIGLFIDNREQHLYLSIRNTWLSHKLFVCI